MYALKHARDLRKLRKATTAQLGDEVTSLTLTISTQTGKRPRRDVLHVDSIQFIPVSETGTEPADLHNIQALLAEAGHIVERKLAEKEIEEEVAPSPPT